MGKLSSVTRGNGKTDPSPRRLIGRVLCDAASGGTPRAGSCAGHPSGPIGFPSVPVQILEDETAYRLTADLDGLHRDDIEVVSDDGVVTIIGTRTLRRAEGGRGPALADPVIEQFEHRFNLPDGIDLAGITAELVNGILTVTLPKSPASPHPVSRARPAV